MDYTLSDRQETVKQPATNLYESPDTSDPPLRLLALDEFATRPIFSWLYRDLLAAETITVVFGAPKSGKTNITMDMMMHAAHGMHWHNYMLTRPLRVAYLAGEGHNGLRTRLHAWQNHHATEIRGDIRILPEALSLAGKLDDVLDALRPYGPDVVVVDTLNAYFGTGDENSTKDMTAFVSALRRLRDDLHTAVMVIHHTGLADASRERGSSVLRAAADTIIQIARDTAGSGLVGAQVVDARDAEPWTKPLSLRIVRADTDWADDEGQRITTCLVEAGDRPVTLPSHGGKKKKPSKFKTKVINVVQDLAEERGNGDSVVLLPKADIAKMAIGRGVTKTSAYRLINELEKEHGWQLDESECLRIDRADL